MFERRYGRGKVERHLSFLDDLKLTSGMTSTWQDSVHAAVL